MSPTDIAVLQNELKHLSEKFDTNNKIISDRMDKYETTLGKILESINTDIEDLKKFNEKISLKIAYVSGAFYVV